MSRVLWIGLASLLGFAAGTSAAGPAGVDLAGLTGWDIVVAADASPSETYAADEFQSIFAQATGIKLVYRAESVADRQSGGL